MGIMDPHMKEPLGAAAGVCDRPGRLDRGGRFIGRSIVPAPASPKISGKDPAALSERMIWHIVTKYARQTGLVDQFARRDMRLTCARLCRESCGDLEQIQFLLGHASTTERYPGSRQNLKEAVNDRLGLDE